MSGASQGRKPWEVERDVAAQDDNPSSKGYHSRVSRCISPSPLVKQDAGRNRFEQKRFVNSYEYFPSVTLRRSIQHTSMIYIDIMKSSIGRQSKIE